MDVVVVSNDGDEGAVLGAFAIKVALDEGVDDTVQGPGSELALSHVVVVLVDHGPALVQEDDQQTGGGTAPLHFVRVHTCLCLLIIPVCYFSTRSTLLCVLLHHHHDLHNVSISPNLPFPQPTPSYMLHQNHLA